ncbi:alpha-amylase [Thiospirochaeta perfilievii]|uniref:Alpha-amylase n=1 Tax=Thiospirochaeta perfilievii TaxID=252967 RepID=A0A5C1QFV1_9SPIO|nr:alpha-amylase family glycosyl hydrolase [Thiospirochaeta perfilievii]QEN06297.1 alpha-amylase [Thiospirochaeta perfilievii]
MDRSRLKSQSIYSVSIRNHSKSGDIQGLIDDLPRIKDLGVNIIWILPHYPIGKENRRGDIGSPYSVSDYFSVNPELGGLNDFKNLIDRCHEHGLKIIIDIVFNHVSCDSVVVLEHPEWILQNEKNQMIGKIPDWDDVYDLDFSNSELKNYLIEVLHYWAELNIDGFRCDVASVVPLSFWSMAKDTLSSDHRDLIWIAESVDKEFISFIRHNGYVCHSDSELYNVFDILYDYDIQYSLEGYIQGDIPFQKFIDERRNQEIIYPVDYLKLRFLENNNTIRAAKLIKDDYLLINWKAFSLFEKGVPLIYAGEEYKISQKVNILSNETINWTDIDASFYDMIKKILSIDHMDIVKNGIYTINALADNCVHLRYRAEGETLHGIFNFGKKDRNIKVEVLKGDYLNIVTGENFSIDHEKLNLKKAPYIFKSIP